MSKTNYHEQNRQSWNNATKQHHSHKPDLIERYKNGANNLHLEDMQLLGDISGKRLAHLQCNDGQDSISIANYLGAEVTGIDISDEAIAFAKRMSDETGIPADFVRSDIFDWFDNNSGDYDALYTSYGVMMWISDVTRWAKGVEQSLNAGGKLVLVEFHPVSGMFENDWQLTYDAMGGKPDQTGGVGDYVGNDFEGKFQNPNAAYEFAWSPGEIISALLASGMQLTHFKEYPYMNGWQRFPDMREEIVEETDKSRYYAPTDKPTMPMMYSIVATKPE